MHPLLRAGLVGHLVGGGSGLTWLDRSGYGNHGVLTNGPLWTLGEGNRRNALFFDGVDDYVIATNNTSITSTQTSISVWVNFNTLTTNGRVIDLRDGTNGIQIARDSASNLFVTKHSQFQSAFISTSWNTIVAGKWYHLVACFDSVANTTQFYANGLAMTGVLGPSVGNGNVGNKIYLGIRSDLVDTSQFNGSIDDVRIYNRTLSTAEVTLLARTD